MNEREPVYASMKRVASVGTIVGIAALAACALGESSVGRTGVFQSYLFAYVFWIGLTLGCFALTLFAHVTRAGWALPALRFWEAGARSLPVMLILFAPVLLMGMGALYPWMRPEALNDPLIVHKRIYLNYGAFASRTVVYFGVWMLFTYIITGWSRKQDANGDPNLSIKRTNLSAPGLIVYVLTVTFASVDWVMSLDPHWHSTIWGLVFVVGQGLSGLAFATLLLMMLSKRQPFKDLINPRLMRDLGNMLLTFTILWAYLAFSQWLLIWMGNLPDEITFYLHRMKGGWWYLGTFVAVFQFFVPFLLLLSNRTKLTPWILGVVSAHILIMRVLDIYWTVVPAFGRPGFNVSWTDFAALVGIGGLWLGAFTWNLGRAHLIPQYDARIMEAPEHAQA